VGRALDSYCDGSCKGLAIPAAMAHYKQFLIYVFPERLSRTPLLNNNYIFIKQNYNILCRIMIFWREERYTRCSHSADSIGKKIFPKEIMK
jgi:hypothetical protein